MIDITCQVSGGLPWSNMAHLNLEQIHNLLFPVEKEAKRHLQSSTSFKFHFTSIFLASFLKLKHFLKIYVYFISLFSVLCLPAAVSCWLAIKKFKISTTTYRIQTSSDFLYISHFYWLIPFYYFTSPLKTLLYHFKTIYYFL